MRKSLFLGLLVHLVPERLDGVVSPMKPRKPVRKQGFVILVRKTGQLGNTSYCLTIVPN